MGRRIRGTQQPLILPSVDDIINIHDIQCKIFPAKSEPGIFPTGDGFLDSLIYRIETHFIEGPYSPIVRTVSMLYEDIIRRHPFIDVNKRTGISTAYETCLMNRYYLLKFNSAEDVQFALDIASTTREEIGMDKICKYFNPKIIPYKLYGLEVLTQKKAICQNCGTSVSPDKRICSCGVRIRQIGIRQKGILYTYRYVYSSRELEMYFRSHRRRWLKKR